MEKNLSVIGLGYVGLPVAVAFGKLSKVVGFDVNQTRIQELQNQYDRNLEVDSEELKKTQIKFSSDIEDLRSSNFYIVTVPTPITKENIPDLSLVYKASETIGKVLKKGDVVVYESTVYPGVTEEKCIPLLEKISGLQLGEDFKVGYSPERINPGDKEHTFTKIKKVVSGSDQEALDVIADTYSMVVTAGVFRGKSIKVTEAAKVIENTQRDINIAFMNELSIIFDKLDINTTDVLEAASTKWNFLNFYPGLVGGHCIGVDPYYLTHKAESMGYHPEVILSGRRINDNMGKHIAEKTIKEMILAGHDVSKSSITLLGLTFKENTPDIRNSKIVDIIKELESYGVDVQVHDPLANKKEAEEKYGIILKELSELKPSEAIILGVAHRSYNNLTISSLKEFLVHNNPVIINIRSHFKKDQFDLAKTRNWSL